MLTSLSMIVVFRIHEYLPDSVVPYFEAFVDTLLDLLLKANIISSFKRSRPASGDAAVPESEFCPNKDGPTKSADEISCV
jgi:hypothetical protein